MIKLGFDFNKRLFIGFLLSISMVVILSITAITALNFRNQFVAIKQNITRANNISNWILSIELKLLDMENGIRGFILTKNKDFLKPNDIAKAKINIDINHLRQLIKKNDLEHTLLQALIWNIKSQENYYEKNLNKNNTKNLIYLNYRKNALDYSRTLTKEIQKIEKRNTNYNENLYQKIYKSYRNTLIAGAILILLDFLVLFIFFKKTLDKKTILDFENIKNNNKLQELINKNQKKEWILEGGNKLNEEIKGDLSLLEISEKLIHYISRYCKFEIGIFYLFDGNYLNYFAGFGHEVRKKFKGKISLKEGLIGQVAFEKRRIIFEDLPESYFKIESGILNAKPNSILIQPILNNNKLIGVMEFASIKPIDSETINFIDSIIDNIAISITMIQSKQKRIELLNRTQEQTLLLENQQEELKKSNEALEHQAHALVASEEELRVQQEELKQSNLELERKANELELKNHEIELARKAVILKSKEVEKASNYKSDFLANMSHELRTPLNSILILSNLLVDNKEKNLTEKQIDFGRVIAKAGTDLLNLINDILDISKIESGKMELIIEKIPLSDLEDSMDGLMEALGNEKHIKRKIVIEPNLIIESDKTKVEQILKNLLSNAFKFSNENGIVELTISKIKLNNSNIKKSLAQQYISFEVKDAGIGISSEKQNAIFDAFIQSDASTNRKYGGTGLGLSISKALAKNLGGEIQLKSEINQGSTFTLILPMELEWKLDEIKNAHQEEFNPILIDMEQMDLLEEKDKIKVGKIEKKVLIIEDDEIQVMAIKRLLKNESQNIHFEWVTNGEKAQEILDKINFDCIILDLSLGQTDSYNLIKNIKTNKKFKSIPVVVYTGTELNEEQNNYLKKYANTIIVKTDYSKNRLYLETHDILKKNIPYIPENEIEEIYDYKDLLKGKHVLIVDDDIRNIFAISAVLEHQFMKIDYAINGIDGLAKLSNHPYDIILMDIMMPEMNGYECMIEIRKNPNWKKLPIIALTAKVMQGDKEKCIQAGASDYISKPVNNNQLLSLMRVWLFK